jgi:hypothetical protein
MGFHADVQNGIVALLEAALPDRIPVFNLLAVTEREFERTASSVSVMRETIDYEPHPEINPETATLDQGADWTWVLYIVGGAGKARHAAKGADVDLVLEAVQTALNAQRPTTDCGPLHLVSEDFEEQAGTSVAYVQRWRHRRLA